MNEDTQQIIEDLEVDIDFTFLLAVFEHLYTNIALIYANSKREDVKKISNSFNDEYLGINLAISFSPKKNGDCGLNINIVDIKKLTFKSYTEKMNRMREWLGTYLTNNPKEKDILNILAKIQLQNNLKQNNPEDFKDTVH